MSLPFALMCKSILLTAPGMDDLEVPILGEGAGKEATVCVWSANMVAIDQGDRAADWINTFLADARGNRKLRFFRVKDSFKRATDPKYAPGFETGAYTRLKVAVVHSSHSHYDVFFLSQDLRTDSRSC